MIQGYFLKNMTIKGYLRSIAYLILPEPIYIRLAYWAFFHEKLNQRSPQEFTEKLWWLKTYYKTNMREIMQSCYDKFLVREYVNKKVGKKYLNKLLGYYIKPEDINFEELPDQFVIKITQSCGLNYICKDKNKINEEAVKELLDKWIRKSKRYKFTAQEESFLCSGKPRIICEKYLYDGNTALNDYKIYCFNGKPQFIRVCVDPVDEDGNRKKKFLMNTYDLDWNYIPVSSGQEHYADPSVIVDKPENLLEMIHVAAKLSEDFPFVRVDLYNINGRIVFGELTWIPGGASNKLEPLQFEEIFGDLLMLPTER